MPKFENSNPNTNPSLQSARQRPNWIVALTCLVLGTYLSVALVDFDPTQITFNTTGAPRSTNLMGWIGADTVGILLIAIGISVWLLPILLGWTVYAALKSPRQLTLARISTMAIALLSLAALSAMMSGPEAFDVGISDYFPKKPGGLIGGGIYEGLLVDALGVFGSGLLLSVIYVLSLMFIFTKDIGAEIEKQIAAFHAWRDRRAKEKHEFAELRRKAREEQIKQKAESTKVATAAALTASKAEAKKTLAPVKPVAPPVEIEENTPAKAVAAALAPKPEPVKPKPVIAAPLTDTKSLAANAGGKIELNIVKPEEPKKAKVSVPQSDDANYQFPPLSLLKEQVKNTSANIEEEHRQNAENLLRILSEFGVEVSLGEIHVGPVITRYELVPAAGVRVEKIAGLDKNIALGMRAQSVRILAPIPGKAAVGVEVPNQVPTPVGMREIIESEDWAGTKAELPIALGKDVSGKPLISDLSKMPHLLIAGATGSGKSVCINSIVASILYSKSPKDIRLIMVDPKVVELKIFNTLPHMLIPVVTEPKKVPGALKWLLGEMEQRYQIFAKVNVRNIIGFNGRKKDTSEPLPPEAQGLLTGVDPLDGIEIPERMPYIVAIIDELADLMMVAPAEIETSIARLAQLARAAGIHLIIATQRPSVNVITGVIKANLPSRIAFQVASQVDSRTILDTKGADTLIGRGDMLFSPPGSSRLVRAQGAFVSDEEVIEMVEFLKRNGPPQYAQSVQQQIDRAAKEDDDEGEDSDTSDMGDDEELFKQALDVLKSTRRASTSMIQRRLRIGYNRAARIMDLMEDKGIVGPENGSSPRDILVDLDNM